MINPLHKDIITNAIRVLRARRVRPNLKKIAWLVQREHSLSEKTLLALIETLVESKDILRVHFKGGISYRIPPTSSGTSYDPAAPNREVSSESDSDAEFEGGRPERVDNTTTATRPVAPTARISKKHLERQASAPRPRMHAGPQMRVVASPDAASGASDTSSLSDANSRSIDGNLRPNNANTRPSDANSRSSGGNLKSSDGNLRCSKSLGISDTRDAKARPSISDTISRVIMGDGGGVSGGAAPEGDESMEFETPCAPPRVGVRGARRGRPPLSSLGLPDGRRPRQLSARPKRAKRVYDPSEGGVVELLQAPECPSSQYPPTGGAAACSTPPAEGRTPSCGGVGGGGGGSCKRRPAPSSSGGFCANGERGCDICQTDPGASEEFLLRCCSCPATGHPSCLGYSAVLAERSRKQPWTCMDCKHCTVCNMDHLMGTLIFCDECDRAFHLTCHHPPLHTQPLGTWVCCYCSGQGAPLTNGHDTSNCNSSSGGGFPLTPRDSPIPGDEESRSSGSWGGGSSGFDPSIPNATHWTVEEVVAHFEEKGFEEAARCLRDQAIDGSAVLLLSRSDVVSSLGLKLGPALKLYRHVRVLQTRLPHPPLHA